MSSQKPIKGIVLAGGKGTRLYPLTQAISKQLLPVYDQPMIYYPIRTLMSLGVAEALVIVSPDQKDLFEAALANIDRRLIKIDFAVQPEPRGLAEAFIIAEEWLDGADAALILGDNVFVESGLTSSSLIASTIFTYNVQHPERYGVAVVDKDGSLVTLVEKPETFISNNAVVGLYILPNRACAVAKTLTPSNRGEIEIVDLILELDKIETINVQKLKGFWFDCGNVDDLLDCANFIRAVNCRSGRFVGLQHETIKKSSLL